LYEQDSGYFQKALERNGRNQELWYVMKLVESVAHFNPKEYCPKYRSEYRYCNSSFPDDVLSWENEIYSSISM
jgi:hypothetical protein